MSKAVCTVVDMICRLHQALGMQPVKGQVWIHKLNKNWTIAINGKSHAVEIEPEKCMKAELRPIDFAVWWNGWLAGLFNPHGGIFAAGSGANEDAFIEVVEKAIEGCLK